MNNLLLPLVTNVVDNPDFLQKLIENFSVHFSILIVALFLVRLIKISLFNFMGLYVILGGINAGILYLADQPQYIIPSLIALVVGLVLTMLLSGMAGANISQHNYQAILVAIGLFPWYLSFGPALVFGVASFVLIIFGAHFKIGRAFKKIGVKRFNIKNAKERLTEEQYDILRKYGSMTYSMPLLIATLITLLMI